MHKAAKECAKPFMADIPTDPHPIAPAEIYATARP